MLGYSRWSDRDEWSFEGPQGKVTGSTLPCIRSNNGDICRAGALQDQGIILQPTFLVGGDLVSGALVEPMREHRTGKLDIYAMFSSRKQVSPKVRPLVDLLVEWFKVSRWADAGKGARTL